MRLLVDIRGKEINIIKNLLVLMNTPFEIKQTFADFVLMDGDDVVAVFERKTMNDFVSSLGNRINEQALRMLPYVPASFFILVGDLAEIRWNTIPEEHFFGAIASLAVRDKINFLWVKTNAEAIVLIDKICQKLVEGKLNIPSFAKKETQKLRIIALSFCWGVRPDVAKRLLKEFGTIIGVVNASEDDFKRMGLSRRIYRSIQDFYKG